MVHCIFQNLTRKAWKTLKTVSNKYSQQITDVPDSDKVVVEAQKTKRPLNSLTLWSQCLAWPQQQNSTPTIRFKINWTLWFDSMAATIMKIEVRFLPFTVLNKQCQTWGVVLTIFTNLNTVKYRMCPYRGRGGTILHHPPHFQFYTSKISFESLNNLWLLNASHKP